ncbi:hypothetical protein [Streptomyces sp. NPDC051211]|uniref:hypothetical protein n=1 Tax=Streptomyces sp. NPDC051211 TaxID=3154643 RepID=UPI00344D3E23
MTDPSRYPTSALRALITALRTRIIPQLSSPQTDLGTKSGSLPFALCLTASLALNLTAGPQIVDVTGLALALWALGRSGG